MYVKFRDIRADNLILLIAEQLIHGIVRIFQNPVGVDDCDGINRLFKKGPELLFTCPDLANQRFHYGAEQQCTDSNQHDPSDQRPHARANEWCPDLRHINLRDDSEIQPHNWFVCRKYQSAVVVESYNRPRFTTQCSSHWFSQFRSDWYGACRSIASVPMGQQEHNRLTLEPGQSELARPSRPLELLMSRSYLRNRCSLGPAGIFGTVLTVKAGNRLHEACATPRSLH